MTAQVGIHRPLLPVSPFHPRPLAVAADDQTRNPHPATSTGSAVSSQIDSRWKSSGWSGHWQNRMSPYLQREMASIPWKLIGRKSRDQAWYHSRSWRSRSLSHEGESQADPRSEGLWTRLILLSSFEPAIVPAIFRWVSVECRWAAFVLVQVWKSWPRRRRLTAVWQLGREVYATSWSHSGLPSLRNPSLTARHPLWSLME